jgi:putative transposase
MGKRGYPPEFRRRVLDLVEAGRKVAEVAHDLGISDQTVDNWRRQDRVDRGLEPGLTTAEKAELVAARKRIRELEAELAVPAGRPSCSRSRPTQNAVRGHRRDGRRGSPRALACRVLDVSESGFYAWRTRPPSGRAIRHAWLPDLIRQIHLDFRGVYGYRRVHAELTLGHGLAIGDEAVWLLMRKAGLQGLSGRPASRRIPNQPTAGDLVDRNFARSETRSALGHRHRRALHP